MNIDSKLSRRNFIKVCGVGGFSLYLQGDYYNILGNSLSQNSPKDNIGPIETIDALSPRKFYGDSFKAAHKYLRDGDPSKIKPTRKEKKRLVIVGGGLSGIFSASLLKVYDPLILEQGPRLGGNAQAQSWRGLEYPLGSAYVVKPAKGSEIEALFKQLGLLTLGKSYDTEDPSLMDGKLKNDFWRAKDIDADPKQRSTLIKYFEDMGSNRNGLVYPEIPVIDESQWEYIKSLDKHSFLSFLENLLKAPLDPVIKSYLDNYCYGAFGGSVDEVSAACALNFYCGDQTELMVFPGGNAQITQALYNDLDKVLSPGNIRTNELVVSVRVEGQKTFVTSIRSEIRSDLKNETLVVTETECEAAIMSCPKFVINRVLQDIEPERRAAISKMKYRPYLTANILLNVPIEKFFYSLRVIESSGFNHMSTDVAYGSFASNKSNNTVLTIYRPLGREGDRVKLLEPAAYERFRKSFEDELREKVFSVLNLKNSDIFDIRISRFGHALPLAAPGLLVDDVGPKVRAPFKDRVFFVEQDNWALPAVETCFLEASYFRSRVEKILNA